MHCTDSTVKLLQYQNAIGVTIQECEIRSNNIYAFLNQHKYSRFTYRISRHRCISVGIIEKEKVDTTGNL